MEHLSTAYQLISLFAFPRPVRFATLVAVALLLLPAATHATDFKCGKKYITFTHETTANHLDGSITVPKTNILQVHNMNEAAKMATAAGGPRWVVLKHPLEDTVMTRVVDEVTSALIIDCLN